MHRLQVTRSIAPRTLRECRKAGQLRGTIHQKSLLKLWWLQDPRNGHQIHISYFNIVYLWSHQLYTADIKTNLDPRVLNFCWGFGHSTSWCFRQRQGRTSMASSCTSNATDCNVTMPRGVARSTGQTTSTLDWAEQNAGFFQRNAKNRKHLPFQWSFVPRFWGAPVSWRSTCQIRG